MFIKPQEFTATLQKKVQLTEDVWEFDFVMPEGAMPYESGQFAMVLFDHEGEELQRAYSISSPAHATDFQLCVKLLPDGRGSHYLGNLQAGDAVKFKGPFGMFYLKPDNEKDLLLVATGTGIAPMKGIITDLLQKGDQRQINLVFGVRYPQDLFYQDYFQELAAKHDNFNLLLTCSRPEGDWQGETGRVTDHLDKYDLASESLHMFICGNGEMVKSVRQQALDAGMEKGSIHVENFG